MLMGLGTVTAVVATVAMKLLRRRRRGGAR